MPALRHRRSLRAAVAALLAVAAVACQRRESGPRELLEHYFATAARQDYDATWECYDATYRSRIPRDEYVRHRRQASRLESWRILAVTTDGGRARATVELVFAPSARLARAEPVTTNVEEELVRERDGWRVKVW